MFKTKCKAEFFLFKERCLKMEFVNFFIILESKVGTWKIYFKVNPSFFFKLLFGHSWGHVMEGTKDISTLHTQIGLFV